MYVSQICQLFCISITIIYVLMLILSVSKTYLLSHTTRGMYLSVSRICLLSNTSLLLDICIYLLTGFVCYSVSLSLEVCAYVLAGLVCFLISY